MTGTTLLPGGYALGEEIAGGGMGSVHRAAAPDGSPVAVKRLLDRRQAVRFEIEGRLLRRLDHPRVVRVLDAIEDGEERYLIMEWVEGQDLARRLRSSGGTGLPEADVIDWALQAAEALGYVHDQQIVHRDVKPQNLMLSPDRGIVLVDFGIARDPVGDGATRQIGTPGFMAPETYAGGPLTARTDVYGLAATTWTLLSGRPPALGARDALPGVDARIGVALRAGLAVDPADRLPSMLAFADALGGQLPSRQGVSVGVVAAPETSQAALLRAVVRTAAGVFDAAATSLALGRPGGALAYVAAWGAGADEIAGTVLGPGQGIGGRVLSTGDPAVVPDCRKDPDFAERVARRTGYVPHTLLATPLLRGTTPVGVLTILDRRDGGRYGIEDLGRARLFADLALAALDADPSAQTELTATRAAS